MFRRLAITCACLAASLHASAQMAQIKPSPGIALTSTIHTAFVTIRDETAHAYPMMDMEFLVWIESVTPDGITYKIHLSSPTEKRANEDVSKFNLIRHVRNPATRLMILKSVPAGERIISDAASSDIKAGVLASGQRVQRD